MRNTVCVSTESPISMLSLLSRAFPRPRKRYSDESCLSRHPADETSRPDRANHIRYSTSTPLRGGRGQNRLSTKTQPDIAFPVPKLQQQASKPTQQDSQTVRHLMRYLRGNYSISPSTSTATASLASWTPHKQTAQTDTTRKAMPLTSTEHHSLGPQGSKASLRHHQPRPSAWLWSPLPVELCSWPSSLTISASATSNTTWLTALPT